MKLGNHSLSLLIVILFFFKSAYLNAQEKINLQDLQPTFEEEPDSKEFDDNTEVSKIKSKKKKLLNTTKTIVKLRALDKITAKTSSIKIAIGEKKNFGKLEIKPLKCGLLDMQETTDTVAYIQVKDMSAKDNNRVFIFNGWTFASSPTLRSIDHPIYDLWLIGCENV